MTTTTLAGETTTTVAGEMRDRHDYDDGDDHGERRVGLEHRRTTSGGPSFTTTNNQVQGVDELDIVKTDGTYLYVASSQTVTIIRAYPVNASSVVSTINLPNFSVIGMRLAPQRLAILAQSLVNSSVTLRLYDVSNPSAPILLNSMGVERRIRRRKDDPRLLLPGSPTAILYPKGRRERDGHLPDGRRGRCLFGPLARSTYYTPNRSQISVYTMVLSMSMSTGVESSVAVLTGPSSTIYVSASNIYVVYSNFYPHYADGIAGDVYNGGQTLSTEEDSEQNSTVFRVAYSAGNITVAAAGSFPGGVLNQYSMNEYDELLHGGDEPLRHRRRVCPRPEPESDLGRSATSPLARTSTR